LQLGTKKTLKKKIKEKKANGVAKQNKNKIKKQQIKITH